MSNFQRIALFVLAAVVLEACSQPSTFTATSDISGKASGMTVTLTLDDFSAKNDKGGGGTLRVVRNAQFHKSTPDGSYQVTWKWYVDGDRFYVSVPGARAGLEFRPSPLGPQDRTATVFWCPACENNRDSVGELQWIPGMFKRDG